MLSLLLPALLAARGEHLLDASAQMLRELQCHRQREPQPEERVRLEQTDEAHEFVLPTPSWLGSASAPWAEVRRRGYQVVALHGDGVVLRRARDALEDDGAAGASEGVGAAAAANGRAVNGGVVVGVPAAERGESARRGKAKRRRNQS